MEDWRSSSVVAVAVARAGKAVVVGVWARDVSEGESMLVVVWSVRCYCCLKMVISKALEDLSWVTSDQKRMSRFLNFYCTGADTGTYLAAFSMMIISSVRAL